MSWKETCVRVGDGHFVLPRTKGMRVDVDLFLSDKLFWGPGEPLGGATARFDTGVEEAVFAQFVSAASLPGVTRVVGMPDTHVGYGVPIGCVIESADTLYPTAAGYDIGCGMDMLVTTLTADDVADPEKRRRWCAAVAQTVGLGVGVGGQSRTLRDVRDVLRYGAQALGVPRGEHSERDYLPVLNFDEADLPERARGKVSQLGSLGGGNHFMELELGDDGRVYVMVHTGSRGFGYQIAKSFFDAGAELLGLPRGSEDDVWLDGESGLGHAYWNQHNVAGNFAIANRVVIAQQVARVTEEVFGGEAKLFYEISHNLIQRESGKLVARKGATRAFPAGHPDLEGTCWESTGHPILTPGSMRDGSAILYALAPVEDGSVDGAAKSAYSVNHGAGRRLSRGVAKRSLSQRDVDLEMATLGIAMNTALTPLEESGDAYKPLDDVLAAVEEAGLARVAVRLRPLAVVKGND